MNTSLENSAVFQKEIFQTNADFVYRQWKVVDIDGWKTRILDVGKGPAIVFVPVCQGMEAFDSLLMKHFAQNRRVITFQRREDENQDLNRKSRADDLEKVLDFFGIEKAHFVSHSSGSIATTTLALRDPDRFLSYVWMNLSPKPAADMVWWKRWAANLVQYLPLSDQLVVSLVASTCSGEDRSSLLYDRCYEQFMSVKETARVKSLKHWFNRNVWTLANYDWSTGLEALTMPILLMNSDDDLVNSARAMGRLAPQLPNCYGYQLVNGGRHFFQYPCAEQVINYMEAFYAQLEA